MLTSQEEHFAAEYPDVAAYLGPELFAVGFAAAAEDTTYCSCSLLALDPEHVAQHYYPEQ